MEDKKSEDLNLGVIISLIKKCRANRITGNISINFFYGKVKTLQVLQSVKNDDFIVHSEQT